MREGGREPPSNPYPTCLILNNAIGLVGRALSEAVRAGALPARWSLGHRTCVDVSERMLARARAHGGYEEFVEGDVRQVLEKTRRDQGYGEAAAAGGGIGLMLAADLAPYFGDLEGLMQEVAGVCVCVQVLVGMCAGMRASTCVSATMYERSHVSML